MLFVVKIQVLDLHRLSYKFLSLIPYLASGEDIQASNLDWARDFDVPVSSRARVITGEEFMLLVVKLLLTLIFSYTLSILTHYAADSSLS
jgi:hypothetical protein